MAMDAILSIIADGGRAIVGMVQAWVGQKTLKLYILGVFLCPFFSLGPRFHKIRDIFEVVHYNIKLLSATPYKYSCAISKSLAFHWYVIPLVNFLAIPLDQAISGA